MTNDETYYIGNLEELKAFLKGKYKKTNEEKIPLYFIKANSSYILYDESIPYFKKAPEISSAKFLANVKLLLAMHNRYIPIINKNNRELLFSEEEFLMLRSKMGGLKRYGCEEYKFSSDLSFPGIDEYITEILKNNSEIDRQANIIKQNMQRIFTQLGIDLSFKHHEGVVKLLDTGSTSRGTSVFNNDSNQSSDFDFLLRVPNEQMESVKKFLITNLKTGDGSKKIISRYRIRLFGVKLEGLDEPIDIDISFVDNKKDYYATEEAISDRLEQIKQQDEIRYRMVLANIVLAKKVLKEAGVYKPSRSDKEQAGLGGVGIENWILQYGGSFKDAAMDFLKHAQGKSFVEFEKEYQIFDFGCNHMSMAKHKFPYDNFVIKNMRENGFLKMQQALIKYINSLPKENALKL